VKQIDGNQHLIKTKRMGAGNSGKCNLPPKKMRGDFDDESPHSV
jgi:hypothetical protein